MEGMLYDPELLGLQVTRRTGKEEVMVFCPYHHDTNPSATYNLIKGVFHCFGCQTAKTAKQIAEDLGGRLVPMFTMPDGYLRRPEDDYEWVKLLANENATSNKYLESRDVADIQVIAHQLLQNDDGIIFPILDKFDQVVGVQIRHYTRRPKYLFYGQRQPIWPWRHLLPTRAGTTVYVTEGVFGVLNFERKGWGEGNTAVSMMGASTVENCARCLNAIGYIKPVAVMDEDDAGYLAAAKFILLGIPAVSHDFGRDPDDWSREDWVEAQTATPSLDIYDFINRHSNPPQMERTLRSFYRRIS